MQTKARLICPVVALAVAFAPPPSGGATASTSLSVSATVLAPACSAAVLPLRFGGGGELLARPEVSVRCVQPAPYTISIDASRAKAVAIADPELISSRSSLIGFAFRKAAEEGDWANSRTVPNRYIATAKPFSSGDEASSGTIVVSIDY